MAGLRVVTGGSASGKTQRLLGVLSARYIADPLARSLVLVPTVRHGDQFRRRLVATCGAAFGLDVATMQHWARSHGAGVVPQRGVLTALLERATSEAIARGAADHFAPLTGAPGLRQLVERAVADLLADDVTSEALSDAADGDPRLRALAATYRAFRAALEARDWLHPAQLAGAAATALESAPDASVPPLIVVDGFRVYRHGELRLLASLARRAEVIVAFDTTGDRAAADLDALRALATVGVEPLAPVTTPVSRHAASASDREAMLRAIAREVKQVLADNPALRPSDCAVAVRQIGPYLGLARQVFREYDLPLDPAAGVRLGERPLGIWLRRLLHLDEQGWRLRDLVAVLSSAFIDLSRWDVGPRHISLIARLGRRKHLWGGAEAMNALVEALAAVAYNDGADDDGERVRPESLRDRHREASDGLRAALADLRALLAPPSAPLRVHARALDAALFGRSPLVAAVARDLEGAGVEMDALRGCFRSIAAADEALDGASVPFATFIARLAHELDAPAVLLREPGGVMLAPLHTLHGLRFAYLAVGGLVEGEFPARRTTSNLLDREARAQLAANGLVLPPEAHAAEDDLWATASTRADGILSLWRSRLDERGRPAPPSFYFPQEEQPLATPGSASRREGAIEAAAGWRHGAAHRPLALPAWSVVRHAVEIEQQRRSREGAGRFDGDLPPTALPFVTGAEVRWSATRLETYRTCGFQFFSRYVLHLAELDEEQDGADPATRGSVIHAILDAVTKPLERAGRPLTAETVEEVVARLEVEGRDLWDCAPAEYGFGRAGLWRLEGVETLARIAAMLRAEAATSSPPGIERVESELWVNADLPLDPPMRIGSQIDRLDSGAGVAVVVDYKSGKSITRGDVEAGARLQLQLYTHLARAHTGADRVVARYAFLKPPPKPWDLDTARPEDAQLVEDVIEIADRTRDAIDDGRFVVKPSGTCPRWCAYQHACRRNEWTRTKWPD